MSKPNIVIVMTDQQRADVSAREGFPLDTTPFLDRLAREGAWFNRAYTSAPICVAARISLLTGRYPSATRVRSNHNAPDAVYSQDVFDVMKANGYATALVGKNHSHLAAARAGHWRHFSHAGMEGEGRSDQEKAFDAYMKTLRMYVDPNPAPFPVECQLPYRIVSGALDWIGSLGGKPFFLWMSFPEPHNPYQVSEPYYSLFPPESLPPTRSGSEALEKKSSKWQWTKATARRALPRYDEMIPRSRSNYFGMLRLIDDQMKRFVDSLDALGLRDKTLLVFVSDHGDFVGEYGLMRKGPETPDVLMRVPLFFHGPGIGADARPRHAHVSICDIMPTLCEAIGVPMPEGVQGRSLWPMLTGQAYPEREFASAYGEQGFGGLHYAADDTLDPVQEGCIGASGVSFDCLNSWSQSGVMRTLRKGDWKLDFDMQGRGQLYNLAQDPVELDNLFGRPEYAAVEKEMLAEMLAWTIRVQDPLPLPRRRYVMKKDPRNYWAPYR